MAGEKLLTESACKAAKPKPKIYYLNDGGCDLIAEINDKNIICQIKQVRSKKTLSHGVDEIISAKSRFSKANMMCLITNSLRITSSQRKLAREKSVILILGESIEEIGNTLYRDIS